MGLRFLPDRLAPAQTAGSSSRTLSFLGRTSRWLALTAAGLLGASAAQAQYCSSNLGGSCSSNNITGVAIAGTTFNVPGGCLTFPGATDAYFTYPPPPTNTANFTATLPSGTSYQISVGGSGPAGVWIDFNNNFSFDANEFAAVNTSTRVATLFIPATATQAAVRMRVRSSSSALTSSSACSTLFAGQTNDYTVTIGPPVPCPGVSLTTSGITSSGATISFTPSSSATSYTVSYVPVSGGTAQTVSPAPTTSPVTLSGLTAGTAYVVSVTSNCAGGTSVTTTANFTTTGTAPCNPVSNLTATSSTPTTATITFGTQTGVTNYTVTYTAAGGSPQTVTSTSGTVNLSNLLGNTAYSVSVVTNCTTGLTSAPATASFTTPLPPCNQVTNLSSSNVTGTSATISFTASTNASSYTATYTALGGTPVTITPAPTGSPFTLTGLDPSTTYTVSIVSNCGAGVTPTSSPATTTFNTPCGAPAYALVDASTVYTQDFETGWPSICATQAAPSNNWRNTPLTGNNSWRRDDQGASANWTQAGFGGYTPTGSNANGASSAHSARFHLLDAAPNSVGTLDLYVNLPTSGGTPTLTFDYQNAFDDFDTFDILLSTNGGTSFGAPLLVLPVVNVWTRRTVVLPSSVGPNTVIRFRATVGAPGFNGASDFGLDNVRVEFVPCSAPTAFTTTSLSSIGATIGFTASASATSYTVTYQAAGGTLQTISPNPTTAAPITLTGLTPSTVYTVNIVSNCGGGATSPVLTGTFTTPAPPPCNAPTALTSGTLTPTTASIAFTPSATANNYTVTYQVGTGTPLTLPTNPTTSPVALTGLTPGTTYTVSISSNCASGTVSPAATTTFTTPICDAPTALTSTNVTATGVDLSFTPSTNATSYVVTYTAAGGMPQTLTPGPSTLPFSLSGLTPSTVYTVSIVSNCGGGSTSAPLTGTFTTLAPPCAAPTAVLVNTTTSTGASISFTPSTTASSYTVTYNSAGGQPVTLSPNPTTSPVLLSGLLPSTAYTVTIVSNCTNAASPTSPTATATFTTAAPPCLAPTGLATANLTATSTDINFTPGAGNVDYTVTYTRAGGTAQTVTPNPTASPVRLSGLTASASYSVSIVANCAAGSTAPAATLSFMTPLGARNAALAGLVQLYPNPAHRTATLRLPAGAFQRTVQLSLHNSLGQQVQERSLSLTATGAIAELDLSGLPAGVYSVHLHSGAELVVKRLVVE